jgi:hypothetical protein
MVISIYSLAALGKIHSQSFLSSRTHQINPSHEIADLSVQLFGIFGTCSRAFEQALGYGCRLPRGCRDQLNGGCGMLYALSHLGRGLGDQVGSCGLLVDGAVDLLGYLADL